MKRYLIGLLSVALLLLNINVYALNSTVRFIGTNISTEEACKNIIDENSIVELYFDGKINIEQNSACNIIMNGEIMSAEKLQFSAEGEKVALKFLDGALVQGSDYILETDNLVDEAGNVIYTPKLQLTASGEDIISEHWELKKGNKLLMFDGKVNGTVNAGVKVTNLGLDAKSYSVKLEKTGVYGSVACDTVTKEVKSGETVDLSAEIQATFKDNVFLHIWNGDILVKSVEVTKNNIPEAAMLVDDYWGDGFWQNGKLMPSGWNIDRGSNNLEYINTESLILNDISGSDGIVAEKQFLAGQKGEVVFETRLSFSEVMNGAAVFAVGYNGDTAVEAVKIEVVDGNLVAYDGIVPYTLTAITAGSQYAIRVAVNIDEKSYSITVNDRVVKSSAKLSNSIDTICCFKISTPAIAKGKLSVGYLKVHRGYLLNEQYFSNAQWTTDNDVRIQSQQSGKKNDLKSVVLGSESTNKIGSIRKNFGNLEGNSQLDFKFMLTGDKEFKMMLYSGDYIIFIFEVYGNKAMANGTEIETLKENVWHDGKMIINQAKNKYEFYVNGRKQCEDDFVFAKNTLGVAFEGTGEQVVDDIVLSPANIYDTDIDMPSKDDIDVHMISYPMWREGSHFGWDRLALYEERVPYIGTYDDGNVEAMNMQLKWLAEHNVDTLVFPFVRANANKDNMIKYYTRQEALQDGYFNSPYNSYVELAIMWSGISSYNCGGSVDFRTNIVPYWIEHFFKNENYAKTDDNKLILYVNSLDSLINVFGDAAKVQAEISYLDEQVKKLGTNGVYIIASADVTLSDNYTIASSYGIDALFQYSEQTASTHGKSQIKRISDAKRAMTQIGQTDFVPTVYMGYDTTPWRGSNNGGALTPAEYEAVLETVKTDVSADLYSENKIVTLGNWNEFGEGHYLMPTSLYGFAYLDAVRNVFGEVGEHEDEIPDMQQKRSSGWLYQNAGTALRAYERTDDIYNYDVVKGWYFDDPNCVNDWISGYKDDYYKIENGQLKIISNRTDYAPNMKVDVSNLGIDTQNCKYIRVNISGNWDKSAGKYGLFYFTTDTKTDMFSNDAFRYGLYKNGVYEIDLSNNDDWTGILKELCFWPGYYEKDTQGEERLSVSIKSIEILGENN